MNRALALQEIAIVVSTPNQNPQGVTLESLQYTGVIPTDWEIARTPIYTKQGSQLVFKNGVAIAAQSDRVMFLEALNGKSDSEFQVAAIAEKYVAVMQHIDYRAVGINLRGYVEQASEDEARDYLSQTLLASGPWKEVGQEAVRASINLTYALEEGRFNLSVNEASVQLPTEDEAKPAILFSGNFSHDLSELEKQDKADKLSTVIRDWQTSVDTFRDLVNTKFLTGSTPAMASTEAVLAAV